MKIDDDFTLNVYEEEESKKDISLLQLDVSKQDLLVAHPLVHIKDEHPNFETRPKGIIIINVEMDNVSPENNNNNLSKLTSAQTNQPTNLVNICDIKQENDSSLSDSLELTCTNSQNTSPVQETQNTKTGNQHNSVSVTTKRLQQSTNICNLSVCNKERKKPSNVEDDRINNRYSRNDDSSNELIVKKNGFGLYGNANLSEKTVPLTTDSSFSSSAIRILSPFDSGTKNKKSWKSQINIPKIGHFHSKNISILPKEKSSISSPSVVRTYSNNRRKNHNDLKAHCNSQNRDHTKTFGSTMGVINTNDRKNLPEMTIAEKISKNLSSKRLLLPKTSSDFFDTNPRTLDQKKHSHMEKPSSNKKVKEKTSENTTVQQKTCTTSTAPKEKIVGSQSTEQMKELETNMVPGASNPNVLRNETTTSDQKSATDQKITNLVKGLLVEKDPKKQGRFGNLLKDALLNENPQKCHLTSSSPSNSSKGSKNGSEIKIKSSISSSQIISNGGSVSSSEFQCRKSHKQFQNPSENKKENSVNLLGRNLSTSSSAEFQSPITKIKTTKNSEAKKKQTNEEKSDLPIFLPISSDLLPVLQNYVRQNMSVQQEISIAIDSANRQPKKSKNSNRKRTSRSCSKGAIDLSKGKSNDVGNSHPKQAPTSEISSNCGKIIVEAAKKPSTGGNNASSNCPKTTSVVKTYNKVVITASRRLDCSEKPINLSTRRSDNCENNNVSSHSKKTPTSSKTVIDSVEKESNCNIAGVAYSNNASTLDTSSSEDEYQEIRAAFQNKVKSKGFDITATRKIDDRNFSSGAADSSRTKTTPLVICSNKAKAVSLPEIDQNEATLKSSTFTDGSLEKPPKAKINQKGRNLSLKASNFPHGSLEKLPKATENVAQPNSMSSLQSTSSTTRKRSVDGGLEQIRSTSSLSNTKECPSSSVAETKSTRASETVICLSDSDKEEENDVVFVPLNSPPTNIDGNKTKNIVPVRIASKIKNLIDSVINEEPSTIPTSTQPSQKNPDTIMPRHTTNGVQSKAPNSAQKGARKRSLDADQQPRHCSPEKRRFSLQHHPSSSQSAESSTSNRTRSPNNQIQRRRQNRSDANQRVGNNQVAANFDVTDQRFQETCTTVSEFLEGVFNPHIPPSTLPTFLGQVYAYNCAANAPERPE